MNNKLPRFWILWGLWPEASAYMYYEFVKRLLNKNIIHKNSDFPSIFIENASIDFDDINGQTEYWIVESSKIIQSISKNNPDFIVMCCNTIHLFRDQIIKHSWSDNIINLKDVIYTFLPKDKKICLLWSPATVSCWLYDFDDLDYITFTEEEKALLWDILLNYWQRKDIDYYLKKLEELIEKKKNEWWEFFLYCCTEISEIMNMSEISHDLEHNDTLEIYIDFLVQQCEWKINTWEYPGLKF